MKHYPDFNMDMNPDGWGAAGRQKPAYTRQMKDKILQRGHKDTIANLNADNMKDKFEVSAISKIDRSNDHAPQGNTAQQ